MAQKPKLAPYIEEMRKNIAAALSISVHQVNIKATTEEGMNFTGEGKGISAQAISLLTSVDNFIYEDVLAESEELNRCNNCSGCCKNMED